MHTHTHTTLTCIACQRLPPAVLLHNLYGTLSFPSLPFLRELLEQFGGNDTSTRIDRELELVDLLVDLLHELDDEVHQLVLEHDLGVVVGDEEGDVISLYWLPSEHDEVFRAHHQKAGELLCQDLFHLIRLLDFDADSHRVDRAFDHHLLVLITRDHDGVHQKLFAALCVRCLYFGLVVALHHLTAKVLNAHRGSEGLSDAIEVGLVSKSHCYSSVCVFFFLLLRNSFFLFLWRGVVTRACKKEGKQRNKRKM
mmetsp:Transcript_18745/g.47431  ORF Transcript_18745/g.47431 Transcript_18745/m.47431 type:complete len:253 (-) Transcript_18745:48-806(-)